MKLLCGPMSREVVRIVFDFSDVYDMPMGFVASEGQVPPDGSVGYTGFTLESFTAHMREHASRCPRSNVVWCRDHVRENFAEVIMGELQYQPAITMIHSGDIKVVQPIVERFTFTNFEIGPGEDDSYTPAQLSELFAWAKDQPNVHWISFPSGCLINGLKNNQNLDLPMIEAMRSFGIPMRGHNCDYADNITLSQLNMLGFGAVQTAPQLGVVQTLAYLTAAQRDGVNLGCWMEAVIMGDMWHKWTDCPSKALLVAGHYHYQELPDDFRERCQSEVYQSIWNVLEHFRVCFCEPNHQEVGN